MRAFIWPATRFPILLVGNGHFRSQPLAPCLMATDHTLSDSPPDIRSGRLPNFVLNVKGELRFCDMRMSVLSL
jgi:hypothetical protein